MQPAANVLPRHDDAASGLEVPGAEPQRHTGTTVLKFGVVVHESANAGEVTVVPAAEAHFLVQRNGERAHLAQALNGVVDAGARRQHQKAAVDAGEGRRVGVVIVGAKELLHGGELHVQARPLALGVRDLVDNRQHEVAQRLGHDHVAAGLAGGVGSANILGGILCSAHNGKVIHVHVQKTGKRAAQSTPDRGRRADDLQRLRRLGGQGEAAVGERLQHDRGGLVVAVVAGAAAGELLARRLHVANAALAAHRSVARRRLQHAVDLVEHEHAEALEQRREAALRRFLERLLGLGGRGDDDRRV
mmetsp:Transcript_33582/g.106123  ORF Transcript_33582/g.106123 Transcript_33582/m.106123 type:complete len:303 (+) Transcript_33582:338-1246(+)